MVKTSVLISLNIVKVSCGCSYVKVSVSLSDMFLSLLHHLVFRFLTVTSFFFFRVHPALLFFNGKKLVCLISSRCLVNAHTLKLSRV